MPRTAQEWVALNLACAAAPGDRRRRSLAGASEPAVDRAGREAAAGEIERARRLGIDLLTRGDAHYPAMLRASTDPPLALYLRGSFLPRDVLAVAVVGSRRATPHGERTAAEIAAGLAAAGFTVVSGLARGIDAAAHRGALAADGRTIAVLGSGLDRIYPAEHLRLADEVAAAGALISEIPLGYAPLARNFPERNRIIAGCAWACVVVEAAAGSGSLITADLALQEGRLVYAVPGPVGEPNAVGTNALLREGALVCRSAEDVLEDLAPQIVAAARAVAPAGDAAPPAAAAAPDAQAGSGHAAAGGEDAAAGEGLGADHRLVLAALPAARSIGADALGEAANLPPGRLAAVLLELEIAGLVRRLPGRRFVSGACKI